jgi:hypothetical protein
MSKYFDILMEKNDLKNKIKLEGEMKTFREAAKPIVAANSEMSFTTFELISGIIVVGLSIFFVYKINSNIQDSFFVKLYTIVNKKANGFLDYFGGNNESSSQIVPNVVTPVMPGQTTIPEIVIPMSSIVDDIPDHIHCLNDVMETHRIVEAILESLSRL